MTGPRRNQITVIGYDGSALSAAALLALADATLVVGGERHVAAVAIPEGAQIVVMGDVGFAMAAVRCGVEVGARVVVLASGDPGFFGIVRRLLGLQLPVPVVVLPALSSVAAAFGRVGLPWDDAVIVSAHGRPLGAALNVLRRYGHGSVAVLTDDHSSPARIVEELGEDCPRLIVLERLGEPEERRTTVLPREPQRSEPGVIGPAEAVARRWQSPNLVLTTGFDSQGAAPWMFGRAARPGDDHLGWALPDTAFIHRDGMLTKRDVRAAVLARLAPSVGQLVWDIGAGSGSVGVECSRFGAAVVAVERDESACVAITANATAQGAPVKVVHGAAPDVLAGLPSPNAVFVGGGGPEVVAAVAARRPERVVVALATIERVAPTLKALDNYAVETVLLQVQQLQSLGEGHRLVPTNPIFVISGVLT